VQAWYAFWYAWFGSHDIYYPQDYPNFRGLSKPSINTSVNEQQHYQIYSTYTWLISAFVSYLSSLHKGIKLNQLNRPCGSSMLSLELVLLDKIGFDLEKNPYALNETIRIIIRTITPFLILIFVSYVTGPQDRLLLDSFFVKMKTPVRANTDEDAVELKISYANPHRFDYKKLFPSSQWELDRWTKTDLIGFIISTFVAFGVILFLTLLFYSYSAGKPSRICNQ